MYDLTDYSEYLNVERDEALSAALDADRARFATEAEAAEALEMTITIMSEMGMLVNPKETRMNCNN